MNTVIIRRVLVALALFLFLVVVVVSAWSFANLSQPVIHSSGASGSVFELFHSSGAVSGGVLGGVPK